MTYYEEDKPKFDTSDRFGQESLEEKKERLAEIESAENEGMPTNLTVEELANRVGMTYEEPKYNVYSDYGQHMLLTEQLAQQHQEMMEMLGGIFIQMSRMYDAVMMSLDDEARKTVEHYHSKGKLLGDPPVLEEDAWS